MKKLALILAMICIMTMLAGCSQNDPAEPQTELSESEAAPAENEEAAGLVGTWKGDGTMDIMGLDHEIEFVTTWIFREDGTATSEKEGETMNYTYNYTDDTMTFVKENGGSCGISYTLEGNILSFRTGIDTFAEFIRQK